MIGALRYEWTRLMTLRSTWWISAGSIAIGVGFTFFLSMILALNAPAELEGDVNEEWSRFYLDAAMTQFSNVDPMFYLLAYVIAILGILAWGHEYRHGMIRATLAAVPLRWTVFAAKFLVIGVWVSVVVVISCVLSLLLSLVWFSGLDFQYDWGYLLLAIVKRVVYTVLLTWLVMSVTVLIRHQTFALVLLYLWPMGIETVARLVLLPVAALTDNDDIYELSRFLPFNAGARIIQTFGTDPSNADGFGFQDNLDLFGDPLSAWGGFIVFGGLTFALMGAAYAAFQARDA